MTTAVWKWPVHWSFQTLCRLLHTHSLPFQWCTKGMAKKASQGLLSSCRCFLSGKLLSSFALLRVFSSSSVSCHPDLHLFPGRPPVHPCLQQWKLPSSYACLPGGRGRVQTAADARNSTWRRVHSHFSTDDMGWNKKLGRYWSTTTTYFAHEKIAASKLLTKIKQDKLKKRHLAEDTLPFLNQFCRRRGFLKQKTRQCPNAWVINLSGASLTDKHKS